MKDTNTQIKEAIDFLTQRNYNHNRALGETPRRLSIVWGKEKVAIMERNYQAALPEKK